MSNLSPGGLDLKGLAEAFNTLDPARYKEMVTPYQEVVADTTILTLWTHLSHHISAPDFAYALDILSLNPEERELLFRVLNSLDAENDEGLLQVNNTQVFRFRPQDIPEYSLNINGVLGDNQVSLSSTTQILDSGIVPRVANLFVSGAEGDVLLDLPIYIFPALPVDEALLKATLGFVDGDNRGMVQQPDGRFITIIKNHYKLKDPESFFPETYLAGRALTQIALLTTPSMIVEIVDEDENIKPIEGGPLFCYIRGNKVYYPEPGEA